MVFFPLAMVGYKLFILDYPLAGVIPAVSYRVELGLEADGHGEDISISTYLPKTDSRQIVGEEENSSGLFTIELQSDANNRRAVWNASNVEGKVLPFWQETMEVGRLAARAVPLKYLGVDIGISRRGPILLEINARPGLEIQRRQGFWFWVVLETS